MSAWRSTKIELALECRASAADYLNDKHTVQQRGSANQWSHLPVVFGWTAAASGFMFENVWCSRCVICSCPLSLRQTWPWCPLSCVWRTTTATSRRASTSWRKLTSTASSLFCTRRKACTRKVRVWQLKYHPHKDANKIIMGVVYSIGFQSVGGFPLVANEGIASVSLNNLQNTNILVKRCNYGKKITDKPVI